jgi:DNA-binding response OmpR family regulator
MTTTSPRILVIEKDHLVRELLRDILESDGYRALVTDNCPDPEDVRQLRPTAILLDPFVDGTSGGWGYLRLLREHGGMRHLPVIICTTDHEQLRVATATELGLVSTVILKPFELDELLDAVNAVARPSGVLRSLPWPIRPELRAAGGSD